MALCRLRIAGLAVATALVAMPAAAGVVDFQNDEFNFHVTFPVGSQVCSAVASEHPYGFYAWYGQPTDCAATAKADASASAMGVYAAYNTTYLRSALATLPKACRPAKPVPAATPADGVKPEAPAETKPVAAPVPAPVDAKTLAELNFRRYKSVQCATVQPDGSIDIDVATQAGKWQDGNDPGFETPLINYRATLHTSPDRLDKDLAMFRKFLAKVDIKF
ncbi:MAG TPA: hypothetical protein VG839_03130 [Asticcacaulis sp.]|nr:hypothetical protein [Asticcacaulis sp.]